MHCLEDIHYTNENYTITYHMLKARTNMETSFRVLNRFSPVPMLQMGIAKNLVEIFRSPLLRGRG